MKLRLVKDLNGFTILVSDDADTDVYRVRLARLFRDFLKPKRAEDRKNGDDFGGEAAFGKLEILRRVKEDVNVA